MNLILTIHIYIYIYNDYLTIVENLQPHTIFMFKSNMKTLYIL